MQKIYYIHKWDIIQIYKTEGNAAICSNMDEPGDIPDEVSETWKDKYYTVSLIGNLETARPSEDSFKMIAGAGDGEDRKVMVKVYKYQVLNRRHSHVIYSN